MLEIPFNLDVVIVAWSYQPPEPQNGVPGDYYEIENIELYINEERIENEDLETYIIEKHYELIIKAIKADKYSEFI